MHSLWRPSCSNWKITSASKWFKLSKNFTSFVGTFKSQLKNTDYYWNYYKDDSPLHSLLAHSSFNWKKLTSFIGTFKIHLEKTVQYPNDFQDDRTLHRLGDTQIPTEKNSSVLKWFQRWQTPTSFVGTFKIQLKKTIQYRKGLKDHKTLHPLRGHSNPN